MLFCIRENWDLRSSLVPPLQEAVSEADWGLLQNSNFAQTQAAPKASPVQGEVARRAGGVVCR